MCFDVNDTPRQRSYGIVVVCWVLARRATGTTWMVPSLSMHIRHNFSSITFKLLFTSLSLSLSFLSRSLQTPFPPGKLTKESYANREPLSSLTSYHGHFEHIHGLSVIFCESPPSFHLCHALLFPESVWIDIDQLELVGK